MVLYGYVTQRDVFSKVENFTAAFAFSFYSVFVAVACRGLFKAASSTTHVRPTLCTRSFHYWRDCSMNTHRMKQPGHSLRYYHTI